MIDSIKSSTRRCPSHRQIFFCFWLVFGAVGLEARAQPADISISGQVSDQDTGERLEFAMVILTNLASKGSDFTQTDRNGAFRFEGVAGATFKVEVFYLGYHDLSLQIGPVQQDTSLQLMLVPAVTDLQEVIVRDTLPPIIYRPDTVIYNAKHFYTGRERKLNELIDNLPGLAVDENNKITYQGKEVNTVLVEGEPFFGGNSELAVTGLPADAVGVVEVLENYQPLGFSLHPAAERRIALNVKLREEKRNIVFGDLATGGGPPRNYAGKIDLFNYTPARNLYFLGGSNNTNTELLSTQQRMQLLRSSMGMDDDNFLARYAELSVFQPQPYNTRSAAHLAAVGADLSPSGQTSVSLYGIFSQVNNRFETTSETIFDQVQNQQFTESEAVAGDEAQTLGMLRLDLRHTLSDGQFITSNIRLKGQSIAASAAQSYRASNAPDRHSTSTDQSEDLGAEAVVEYVKKRKKGHTHYAGLSFSLGRQTDHLRLTGNIPFLEDIIDWSTAGETYQLQQMRRLPSLMWSVRDRYVHRFGPRVYLTSQLDLSVHNRDLGISRTPDRRDAQTGLNQNEQSGKLILTARLGEWKVTPALKVYRLGWQLTTAANNQLISLLPSLTVNRAFANIGKIRLAYERLVEPLNRDWFLPGVYVRDFTSYQRGNTDLSPYTTSQVSVGFERNNPLRFSFWGVSMKYRFADRGGVISELQLTDNERFFSYTSSDKGPSSISLSGFFNQDFEHSDLRIIVLGSQARSFVITQGSADPVELTQRLVTVRTTYKRSIGNHSDIRLHTSLLSAHFRRGAARNVNYTTTTSITGKLQAGDWQFYPEAAAEVFQFTEDPIFLFRVSSTIRYQKTRAPWGFELSGAAPLSGRSVLAINQSDLFYRESRRTVFPAYLIAKINYEF